MSQKGFAQLLPAMLCSGDAVWPVDRLLVHLWRYRGFLLLYAPVSAKIGHLKEKYVSCHSHTLALKSKAAIH